MVVLKHARKHRRAPRLERVRHRRLLTPLDMKKPTRTIIWPIIKPKWQMPSSAAQSGSEQKHHAFFSKTDTQTEAHNCLYRNNFGILQILLCKYGFQDTGRWCSSAFSTTPLRGACLQHSCTPAILLLMCHPCLFDRVQVGDARKKHRHWMSLAVNAIYT